MHASRQRHSDSMEETQEEEKITMYFNKIIILTTVRENAYVYIHPSCCTNDFVNVLFQGRGSNCRVLASSNGLFISLKKRPQLLSLGGFLE